MDYENLTPPLYQEKQNFSLPWLKYLLIIPAVIVWYIFFQQILLDKPIGKNPAPDWVVLLITLLIGVGLPLLFFRTQLELEVRSDGFYYRFLPFQRRFRRLLWSDIDRYEKITFSALKDFGGYGVRSHKGETVYIIQGNQGLRFYLRNGKRVVFSASRVDELQQVINSVSGQQRPFRLAS